MWAITILIQHISYANLFFDGTALECVVGCAWISNVTGLRFVDLDGVVEHKLETSIVSLASSAMEGMFRMHSCLL